MGKRLNRLFALAAVFLLLAQTSLAQDRTVVSLALPEIFEEFFADDIEAQFEAENPDLDLQIISTGAVGTPFGNEEDVAEYLDAVAEYAASADVLMLDSNALRTEATRAGYLLDLMPLVNTDPSINANDFYPALWQGFQWDSSMWALPVTGDVTLLYYDPAAFDTLGISYPGPDWTIHDLDFAIRHLTQYAADGSVAVPAFFNFGGDLDALFLSLSGSTLYDETTVPSQPQFVQPALEEILSIWSQLQQDGLLTAPNLENIGLEDIPMQLGSGSTGRPLRLGAPGNNIDADQKVATILPGGRSGTSANAFAISAGTQNPEAAYRLLKFLSANPTVASAFFGQTPARRSLEGIQTDTNGRGGIRFGGANQSPEAEALIRTTLEQGMPIAELRFSQYITTTLHQMNQQQVLDSRPILEELELEARNNLAVAEARRNAAPIVVQNIADIPLAPGEISLNFGITSFTNPLPNEAAWERLIDEFVASDPEVGRILVDSVMRGNLETLARDFDCFYSNRNLVTNGDLSLLLSLDPLMSTDPSFNPSDIIALQQVQSNGQTWAMPLIVQPATMHYSPEIFAMAGAIAPTSGTWTVDQFEDALRTLKSYLGDDGIPYKPQSFGNSHLLTLITAYGGLPLDYRTNPPTVNFTDPDTVEAIRQVLDLAKNGLMHYSALESGVNIAVFTIGGEADIALYSEVGSGFGGRMFVARGGETETPPMVTFPVGSQYTALSYDVGGAYISASSPYAEACYRLISTIAQAPNLFDAMPARRSLINSYEVASSQGEDAAAFYNALDQIMQQPNTIVLPTTQLAGRGGMDRTSYWLNRAFDRYVLEDADLDAELAEAETFTNEYLTCAAAIPPFDPAVTNPQDYFAQISACATQADPTANLGM